MTPHLSEGVPDQDSLWHEAWTWLCFSRRNWPANTDIWDLRWRWDHPEFREREVLYKTLLQNQYTFSPLQVVRKTNGTSVVTWRSRDALVLKWLSYKLTSYLPVHTSCVHVKGHGGMVASRRQVAVLVSSMSEQKGFIFRTDIRGYYRHITAAHIAKYICSRIPCRILRRLTLMYACACIDHGGIITTAVGITRGCALSPLIGASLLYHVDMEMNAIQDIWYTRYMDDILIMGAKRWKLRNAKCRLLALMDNMGFSMHPDKTQIGRIPQVDFDWLGWRFHAGNILPAPRALENHYEQLRLRSEAMSRQNLRASVRRTQLSGYKRRWQAWYMAGMPPGQGAIDE